MSAAPNDGPCDHDGEIVQYLLTWSAEQNLARRDNTIQQIQVLLPELSLHLHSIAGVSNDLTHTDGANDRGTTV